MLRFPRIFSALLLAPVAFGGLTSCTTAYRKSVGADRDQIKSRIFTADFNIAWQAVLESLKSTRLDVSNREAGLVQTKWTDNTAERNFSDGDGGTLPYVKAQYRFRVTLLRGFARGLPAVKISVQREQLIQRDALDELRHQESDLVEEKTLIYRIGRIIRVKTDLARLEEQRTQQEMNSSEFLQNAPAGATPGAMPLDGAPAPETSGSGGVNFTPDDGADAPAF